MSGKRGNGRDKAPSVREDAQEPPVAAPSEEAGADPGEGALTAVSETSLTVATPYAGVLTLPRDRRRGMRVQSRGRRIVIDPMAPRLDAAADPWQSNPCHQEVKDAEGNGEPNQLRHKGRYVELRHRPAPIMSQP